MRRFAGLVAFAEPLGYKSSSLRAVRATAKAVILFLSPLRSFDACGLYSALLLVALDFLPQQLP